MTNPTNPLRAGCAAVPERDRAADDARLPEPAVPAGHHDWCGACQCLLLCLPCDVPVPYHGMNMMIESLIKPVCCICVVSQLPGMHAAAAITRMSLIIYK